MAPAVASSYSNISIARLCAVVFVDMDLFRLKQTVEIMLCIPRYFVYFHTYAYISHYFYDIVPREKCGCV